MPPAKVLVIDDDPYIAEMYLVKLRDAGFTVESGADGKTALEKVQSFKPDVLLLDIVLPVYDGFEVLKHLKENGALASTKVIILSNLGQKEDIERGLTLGASDYIIKAHFTPSEVTEKVRQILKI